MEAAIAAAQAVIEKADATEADVAKALKDLEDAVAALEEKAVEPENPDELEDPAVPDDPTIPEDPADPEKPGTDDKEDDKSPVTGDASMILLWAIVMIAVAVVVFERRNYHS